MERKILISIDWNEVRKAIIDSSEQSSIYIGCDSQHRKFKTIFGLAVVLHIDSCKGGRMFVETSSMKKMTSLRQKLLKEVELAVTGALQIIDIVGKRKFELHLDVSSDPKNASSIICKEAIGYVTAQGLDCVIKPNAFVATHCADHIARI